MAVSRSRQMITKGNNNHENGFTLIEVLMAMLIFSIAILGLLRAGTENIRAVSQVKQKQIAGIIADNQLILAIAADENLQVGTKQDFTQMSGRDWQWKISTEKTSQAGFYKLTIEVREKNSEQVVIKRTAFSASKS